MKFGASSWPFQWDPPYENAIRRIAGLGFKAVELIGWNRDYLKDYYTPETIRMLKSVLAGEGLFLSQFISTPHELSSPDAGKRAAAIDHWKRAVEVGTELGAPILNMVSAYPFGFRDAEYPRITIKPLVQTFTNKIPAGLDWDGNYRAYVEAIRACADICAGAGVKLSIEPHPFRYLSNTDSALRLIEQVNSPALGINFDPSHTFPLGDFPNVSVYRLGKHLLHMHVSDNDGVTNVHWRPGMGKIDWVAMFRAVKEIGYDGVVSIELEDVPGTSRGPNSAAPGVFRHPVATDEFVAETMAGLAYLKGICADIGIRVE